MQVYSQIIYKSLTTVCFILFIFLLFSCQKKDEIDTNPNLKLRFSNDTIIFDTVFTTIGSITKQLKIYNPSNQKIKISSIILQGGTESQYRTNIDGSPNLTVEDIEIAAQDSLFIFVKVLVNPTDINAPFIITDNIEFKLNGNLQSVKLLAWGQNANYILGQKNKNGDLLSIIAKKDKEVLWDSPKPYVIYGTAIVDTNAILNIAEGCKLYFHNSSGLQVNKDACIKINGTLNNPVTFKGDRLDDGYNKIAGSWKGIVIDESSKPSKFNFARIENSEYGIKALAKNIQSLNTLEIHNSILRNIVETAIETSFYNINSTNCLITNCGKQLLKIRGGENINFTHCTFANYWNRSFRNDPAISLSNSYTNASNETSFSDLSAHFENSIIDGRNQEEIKLEYSSEAEFLINFSYSSLKTILAENSALSFNNCILNPSNIFINTKEYNFKLSPESPLINTGNFEFSQKAPIDLLGNSRLPDPDIGAIEYIPETKENSIKCQNRK
jgi:hypothetical protein